MESSENQTQNLYPDLTPSEINPPSIEDAVEKKKQELMEELLKTEEEIGTLKQVLQAKEQYAAEIRKELGITPLAQLKAEINKVQSSQAYQNTQAKVNELNEKVTSSEYYKKTSETLKSAGQATASVFNTIGSSVSSKFSEMKNSPTFKSFEEKVEGVGTTIMAKVSGAPKDEGKGDTGEMESAPTEAPVTTQPSHVDDLPM